MAGGLVHDQIVTSGPRGNGSLTSWPVIAPLVTSIVLLALVFMRELVAAVDVWNASTAYSHCYLVLPMSLYLLWERRHLLTGCQAAPDLQVAWVAVPLTLFWLAAERLGIMEARQLAFIAGLELIFLAVLGRRVYWLISGPLLFLFFLVPFGAFLTPILQQFTATFSIVGLQLLGIPNFSDGFTIETPAGVFFVAEACAGLRFSIAAAAFGVFYSLLSFRSLSRRTIFILASVVVPIVANGIRALGIIVLGQMLGSAEAAAADHLVYGWVFFSFVMLLLIAGGHAFREDDLPQSIPTPPMPTLLSYSPTWCVAGVFLLLSLGPAMAGLIDSRSTAPVLPEVSAIVTPSGCSSSRARSELASRQLSTVVCNDFRFDVSVTAFATRSTSSAMISERRRITQEIGAENSSVSVLKMPNGSGHWTVVQTTDPNRVTAYSGWVDGVQVPSGFAGRVAQARDSLFGADHTPVLITITAPEPADSPASKRKQTLATLTRLVLAQSDLTSRMAALTKIGGD